MSADRGVGVTVSLVSTPASRSQMIWMPRVQSFVHSAASTRSRRSRRGTSNRRANSSTFSWPVSRYRDSATPAMLMDWHEKNAGLQHDDGRNREELERVRVK